MTSRTIKSFVPPIKARLSLSLVLMVGVVLVGCSHQQIKPWGSNTTFVPGWEHIKRSAKQSFLDTETWVPLAVAGVFGFTNLDRKVSDYAFQDAPIYGDPGNALEKSDDYFDASRYALFISSFSTAGADTVSDSVRFKSRALAAQSIAIGLNNLSTATLKVAAKRVSPLEHDSESLTSRHASGAFLNSRLTRINMRYITTSRPWQTTTDITMFGVASLTAWGRVEGGLHYPSDVMIGAAMGNFFAHFVNLAFVNPDIQNNVTVQFSKNHKQSLFAIKYQF